MRVVRGRRRDEVMAAFIVDSPWLGGYGGGDTLDYYFDVDVWVEVQKKVADDLAGAALVPGSWVEFGMAAEPSGWGVPIQWRHDSPPAIHHYPGDIDELLKRGVPNPEVDGLMPAILRRYERAKRQLDAAGIGARMAACRGPLATASHLTGLTEFLMATQMTPDKCTALLEKTTELCIAWLGAQLKRMDKPVGVLVLDDVVGMLSPADGRTFALPYLRRIFEAFGNLIHIYHNDTPNANMLEGLAGIGMDVFNFSHQIDVVKARELLGADVVLMGNVPPLDVLVRGTHEDVRRETRALLEKAGEAGPVLISAGGGISPGTPLENIKAMLDEVARG